MIAPVHNEARVLPELARRGLDAVRAVDPDGAVLLVDDASTDDTRAVPLPKGVSLLSLPVNRGQLGATKVGLAKAPGEVIVVLDGDLQDPPETLPALVSALDATPGLDAVFAVKRSRQDAAWFVAARAVYGLLSRLPGTRAIPAGAGSYVAMRAPLARRVAATSIGSANLAAVVVALGARTATVEYDKAARVDGESRVGVAGLVREALGSLLLTGTFSWLFRLTAWLLLVGSWIAQISAELFPTVGVGILVSLLLASTLDRRRRRLLAPRKESP
jgi:glycosyltransferase involved in cell wall biosynthesis